MNNYISITAENKVKYKDAISLLRDCGVAILLTHFDKKTIFCERPSEDCISALRAEGLKMESVTGEAAPVEPETTPWPPNVTLEEGVHFDVRDEPETFSFDAFFSSFVGNYFQMLTPQYFKKIPAEISHPILGTVMVHFDYNGKGLHLVDDVSFTYEGISNPLEVKTLKVKFKEKPFKDQIKYIEINSFMNGVIIHDGDSLSFDRGRDGGIFIGPDFY